MLMLDSADCRLLTLSDVQRAAQVLSQAFVDDPLCAYMLPIRRTRPRTLQKFFHLYGEAGINNQRGYGAGEPLAGVAFWIFPGQDSLSISLRSLVPLLLTWYPIGYIRARAILERQDALHKKYAPDPHFYLDNIGVLAAARGRGIASKLIRPLLELADKQQVSAYTDTVTRSNVALYEHLGFRCVEESPVQGTDITVWALYRPAQPGG
jgi:ribosomal protein S18 acetylase RimI-like enzyme